MYGTLGSCGSRLFPSELVSKPQAASPRLTLSLDKVWASVKVGGGWSLFVKVTVRAILTVAPGWVFFFFFCGAQLFFCGAQRTY